MPQGFEAATAASLSASSIRKYQRHAKVGVRVELDSKRGSLVTVGDRKWAMILSKEAVRNWTDLGKRTQTRLAVLVYDHTGAAAPFRHRELVLRSTRRGLRIDVVDDMGRPLWSGKANVDTSGNLAFDIPIDRPGTNRKGRMAGHITGNGDLVLDSARLPQPAAREPTLVDED